MIKDIRKHRVKFVKTAAAILAAGALALVLVVSLGGPVLAASFTALGVAHTSHNGSITEVTCQPSGTITWSGFDTAPSTATINLYIQDTVGVFQKISTETLSISGVEGNESFTWSAPVSLTDASIYPTPGDAWGKADFKASADGSTNAQDLTLKIEIDIGGEMGSAEATFTVTVDNEPKKADITATAGTGIQ